MQPPGRCPIEADIVRPSQTTMLSHPAAVRHITSWPSHSLAYIKARLQSTISNPATIRVTGFSTFASAFSPHLILPASPLRSEIIGSDAKQDPPIYIGGTSDCQIAAILEQRSCYGCRTCSWSHRHIKCVYKGRNPNEIYLPDFIPVSPHIHPRLDPSFLNLSILSPVYRNSHLLTRANSDIMTYSNGASHVVDSAPKSLRQLLADEKKIIVAPGVYDGFSARIALEVGFDAIYMVISHIPVRNISTDEKYRQEQEPALPNSGKPTSASHHSMI